MEWFSNNLFDDPIEFVAVILALIYLVLEIRESAWLWLFGILSSLLYAYVYFNSQFYADFGLMIYYVGVSIYGWIHWSGSTSSNGLPSLPIRRISSNLVLRLLLVTVFIYVILLLILLYIPNFIGLSSSSFPYMDSFTVAASLVATWMLARKLLEQWFVWFVVNVLYIYMYWVKGLHPTALLFVIYACGSVIGYITWLRHYRLQQGRLNA